MKYLMLPVHLLEFWYIESLTFFGRSWKNSMLYLEEDMAVGLMWKLLFVPMYHDASFVGRIISFVFRVFRIFLGLFAFVLVTILAVVAALVWLGLPILLMLGRGQVWIVGAWLLLFSGVGLFLIHALTHPHQQVTDIKTLPSGKADFWSASLVKPNRVNLRTLLSSYEVTNLLGYLEIQPGQLTNLVFPDKNLLVKTAFDLAKKTGSQYLDPAHFFVAVIKLNPAIDNLLLGLNLGVIDFENALDYLEKKKNYWRLHYIWDSDFSIHHLKGVNRGWLGVPTPTLDSVSRDLTREAGRVGFPDFIGRSSVVSELINILSQDENRNVCLVGPPGVGRTALINYLAKLILMGDAPPALSTKRLVSLDTTGLLSGIRTQGELADRVKAIFEEVNRSGNIIVVVEEIHNLGIGEAGSAFNLYSLLLPYIDSSAFQFIATTEPENYSRIIERQGAFARVFTKIELPPANPADSLIILENKAIEIERSKRIKVSFISLKKCVELVGQYIHDKVLPDSAMAILTEAETEAQNGWITSKTIESVLSKRVNVPVADLGTADKDKLLNLEEKIHQRFIDQYEAVKVVADTLRRSATGLREKQRPIGSFLFVGPTGVGKTELAKILSEEYFHGKVSNGGKVSNVPNGERPFDTFGTSKTFGTFFRFDMSEYQDPFASQKLIGASGQPGELTEAVRNKPYCLILLDEFEKANPDILNLFLQVFDDGRLTDGLGQTVDFTNTIIIATSNAASLTIVNEINQGVDYQTIAGKVSEELLKIFKPELINRFDSIVMFKPLSEEDMQKIVLLHLATLQNQLLEEGYRVTFSEGLITELAKRGTDPTLGARPLRRLIQDTIESKLSKLILENKLIKGENFQIGEEMLN